jgi:hypothetical protein
MNKSQIRILFISISYLLISLPVRAENEAIFDFSTFILNIPKVLVGEDYYSIDLMLANDGKFILNSYQLLSSNSGDIGKWQVNTIEEPIGPNTIEARLSAEAGESTWYGTNIPELIVRCKNSSLEIFVDWNDLIDDFDDWSDTDHYVTVTANGSESTYIFISSTSHCASFVPSSYKSGIVDSLQHHEAMTFSISRRDYKRITAVFDVRGFVEAYKPINDACNL